MTRSEAFTKRLEALLEEKEMTYADLAKKSGLPLDRIYHLPTLGNGSPGIFTMKVVCDALGITIDEFIAGGEFEEVEG